MPDKAAATKFETDVTRFLTDAGLAAVKPRQTKWYDVGDIHIGDDVVLQAKFFKDFTSALNIGVTGAHEQAGRVGRPFGFAVIKRPGKRMADAYVAMTLDDLVRLLKR